MFAGNSQDSLTSQSPTVGSSGHLIWDSDLLMSNARKARKSDAKITYRQLVAFLWTGFLKEMLQYEGEQDLPLVMGLVDNELSEPYSIFTYRFFLQNWPDLCWLAFDGQQCFGTVVCKQDKHGEMLRGYIAMLVVTDEYRGLGVGSQLVKKSIEQMANQRADEVVLEAEVTNTGALALYQNLGFIRDKRLTRYYLRGSDAFRLKLMLPLHPERLKQIHDEEIAAEQLNQLSISPTLETKAMRAPVTTANPNDQRAAESSHKDESDSTVDALAPSIQQPKPVEREPAAVKFTASNLSGDGMLEQNQIATK